MPFSDIEVELPCAFLDQDSPADEIYRIGLVYAEGIGVDTDIVAAHKWFNLAAARGLTAAKDARQEMAEQMSSEEIAQAQKAAREWMRLIN